MTMATHVWRMSHVCIHSCVIDCVSPVVITSDKVILLSAVTYFDAINRNRTTDYQYCISPCEINFCLVCHEEMC